MIKHDVIATPIKIARTPHVPPSELAIVINCTFIPIIGHEIAYTTIVTLLSVASHRKL